MTEKQKTVPMDINHAPNREWVVTRQDETGVFWGSREWIPAERRAYETEVLVKKGVKLEAGG